MPSLCLIYSVVCLSFRSWLILFFRDNIWENWQIFRAFYLKQFRWLLLIGKDWVINLFLCCGRPFYNRIRSRRLVCYCWILSFQNFLASAWVQCHHLKFTIWHMKCFIQLLYWWCVRDVLVHLYRFVQSDFSVILLHVLLFSQVEYFSWAEHIIFYFYCDFLFWEPIFKKITQIFLIC